MKRPWVSREALDIMRESRDSERENAQVLRHLLSDLTAKYQQLRLAGAVEPVVPVIVNAPPTQPKAEPDALKALVAEMANGDIRLHRLMMKQLRADRASGMADDAIMRRIVSGQTVDEGIPA